MKKRVLIISQNFYPEIGSAANRIKNIYQELKQRGVDVTVLTSEPSYPNRNMYRDEAFWDEEDMEENVLRIHPKTRKYTTNILKRLLLYIEIAVRLILYIMRLEKNYDYIFVSTPPIFVGLAGVFAKKRLKTKLILDVRDLWPESLIGVGVFNKRWILNIAYKLEGFLYGAADQIVINSEGFRDYMLSKGIPEKQLTFMPNSLTEEELHMKAESAEEAVKTVIYTGNIGLAQDVLKLIDIAEHLQDNGAIRFKIIGYGYRKQAVKDLIASRQLHNIEILKPKSRKQTMREVMRADIAYVSLKDEDVFETVLPGKVIDYMCMRKPIVGDVSGNAKRVIEAAGCGVVSASRSVAALAEDIVRLAKNEEWRRTLGDNGHRYAFRELRWRNNIEALLNIMEEKNVEQEGLYVRVEPLHK